MLCNEWNCREQNNDNNNNHEIQNDGCSFFHSRISILVVGDDEARVEGRVISPFISANGGLRDRFIGGIHAWLSFSSIMHAGIRFSISTDTHTAFMPHTSSSTQTSNRDTQHHCLHCFVPSTYLSMVLSCLFADRMNPCNREIIIEYHSGIKKAAPKTHTTANSRCFSSRGSPPRKS